MRFNILYLFPCLLAAQSVTIVAPQAAGILRPAGDATLSNIVVGSSITPNGAVSATADVYLVRTDNTPPRRLTTFDQTNQPAGATSVAISPDGTRAAYLALLNVNGQLSEQAHALDLASGVDRLIAIDTEGCNQPYSGLLFGYLSCLHDLHFSADGRQLIWITSSTGALIVANFDGSGVKKLSPTNVSLAASANVTSADGRIIYTDATGSNTIKLDGTALTQVAQAALSSVISQDGKAVLSEYAIAAGDTGQLTESGGAGCSTQVHPAHPFSSLALSNDGSVCAWTLTTGQLFTNVATIAALRFSNMLDVSLSSDGRQLLYGIGPTANQRGAIWVSDSKGQNPRPVFAPRSISMNGVSGISMVAITSNSQLPLSPGTYFSIYGTNFELIDSASVPSGLPEPRQLANLSVLVNGIAVPIEMVTPWQITAFLPQSFPPGGANVSIEFGGGGILTAPVTIARTAPALLTLIAPPGSPPRAFAFHAGTVILADSSNPAHAGEILETFGFGLGVTSPIVLAGQPSPLNPLALAATPTVTIGDTNATVLFAGLIPGLQGVYQVNIRVPATLAPGSYLMQWKTSDPAYGPGGLIAIK